MMYVVQIQVVSQIQYVVYLFYNDIVFSFLISCFKEEEKKNQKNDWKLFKKKEEVKDVQEIKEVEKIRHQFELNKSYFYDCELDPDE